MMHRLFALKRWARHVCRRPCRHALRVQHAPCRCCAHPPGEAAAAGAMAARVTGGCPARRLPLSLPGNGSGQQGGWGQPSQAASRGA